MEYNSEDLKYICDKDLETYRELRRLKLVITNPRIEIEIYDWKCLPQLEQVELVVAEIVYWELEEQVKIWKLNYPNIVFDIYPAE